MYHTNMIQYFLESVEKYPDRIAIFDNGASLSFRELHSLVCGAAQAINAFLQGKANCVVAVDMPKCAELIIYDLAILYSGNIFMNLDYNAPRQWTGKIIQNTAPALVVSKDTDGQILFNGAPIPAMAAGSHADAPLDSLAAAKPASDLMCLIFTSGSTGQPKSVALAHRSFIDLVEVVRELRFASDNEIVGSYTAPMFDLFVWDMCMLMAYGSQLVLIPGNLGAFPAKIVKMLAQYKVTFILWVPSLMVNIANQDLLSLVPLPDLKMIWFSGEVFPTVKFNYWRRKLPQAVIINMFGPIELTVMFLYYRIDQALPEAEGIPIGRPFPNTYVFLLDEEGRPIEKNQIGVQGEMHVGGASLAAGYYNMPEQTALAFIQNPLNSHYPEIVYKSGDIASWGADGELRFHGRKDYLVKHSGFRIELGEIEIAAFAIAAIKNVFVAYDKNNKKIVMYYESEQPIAENEIKNSLRSHIPHYSIPHIYIHMPEMPRNPNGKIDRNKLKKLAESGAWGASGKSEGEKP